jgi:hypothetical protein
MSLSRAHGCFAAGSGGEGELANQALEAVGKARFLFARLCKGKGQPIPKQHRIGNTHLTHHGEPVQGLRGRNLDLGAAQGANEAV